VKPLKITPAAGGWFHADWGDGRAWFRLALDRQKRLTRIVQIKLDMDNPTPEKLRKIPLNRIHAAVTMRGAGVVQIVLAMRLKEAPTPDMFTTQPEGMELTRRHRLKRPPGKRLDDAFYQDVAHAYQSAVAFGLNPRQAIVADTGAKDATVAGWVLEARRRKHLPPAKPGKVSA
jgi:hypothetical protein